VFYWPRMNAEIKVYILKCDICNSFNPEQLQEHDAPRNSIDALEKDCHRSVPI